jgi:hypothetical protein
MVLGGDMLYVSDGACGLQVLRYTNCTNTLLESGLGSLIYSLDGTRYDFPAGPFCVPVSVEL